MSTPDQITVADGKYTVINDKGKLTALRNGEPWGRDLAGDNLVYWMMVEILRLTRIAEEAGRLASDLPDDGVGGAREHWRQALGEVYDGDRPPAPPQRRAGMLPAHAAPYRSSSAPTPAPAPSPSPFDSNAVWVHAPSSPSYSSDCSSSDSSSSSSDSSSSSCSGSSD